ncbi:unnamed protein product [Moneuplotes crassus]|uniref:Uncharacterized protein n=1 Tax=Euplotes crassus TaxID=5936 RepID=A0AAD1U5T9_EUPCR|nr:unnamed protein product [Moneuplotes crassus]
MNIPLKVLKGKYTKAHKGSWDAEANHKFLKEKKRKGDLLNISINKVHKLSPNAPITFQRTTTKDAETFDIKKKMFSNTRGSAQADNKDRVLVKINFADLLPNDHNSTHFMIKNDPVKSKMFVKNKFKPREHNKFIPSLTKKIDFEPAKQPTKEPQGCTLNNFFDCQLITTNDFTRGLPLTGRKQRLKLAPKGKRRSLRSHLSSPPRVVTNNSSRKSLDNCKNVKCMIHNTTKRSTPNRPSLWSRNSLSELASPRNSINIITSNFTTHKITKNRKKINKIHSRMNSCSANKTDSQHDLSPKYTKEGDPKFVPKTVAKNSSSSVEQMLNSQMLQTKRFTMLRDKFKPKESKFISLVNNLKQGIEKGEINEDEDDKRLTQNGPQKLVSKAKADLNVLEKNNNLLKKLKSEVKVSLKRSVISAIENFKDYKLSSVDEYKKAVPQNPMSHPDSKEFFGHIKCNNFDDVRLMLQLVPNLVYEFDARFQTGLHWAAKRGYSKIVRLLIKYGANINLKDVSGRTALYIACKYNHHDIVRTLLANKANAFIKCSRKITPQDATSDHAIHQMLEKGKMIHVIMRFIPKTKRKTVLSELGLNYFLKDIQKEIESQGV